MAVRTLRAMELRMIISGGMLSRRRFEVCLQYRSSTWVPPDDFGTRARPTYLGLRAQDGNDELAGAWREGHLGEPGLKLKSTSVSVRQSDFTNFHVSTFGIFHLYQVSANVELSRVTGNWLLDLDRIVDVSVRTRHSVVLIAFKLHCQPAPHHIKSCRSQSIQPL